MTGPVYWGQSITTTSTMPESVSISHLFDTNKLDNRKVIWIFADAHILAEWRTQIQKCLTHKVFDDIANTTVVVSTWWMK